jgi:hypothetical protein
MIKYYKVWGGFSLICPDLERYREENPDKMADTDDFNF